MLGGRGPLWVGMSIQNKFLGDKPECSCNCLNLDFMSVTVLAFPHSNSKGEELVRDDVWHLCFARGILIEHAVHLPCFPVAMLLGSVHCSSANCFPPSVSKTLNLSQRGTACWESDLATAIGRETKSLFFLVAVDAARAWTARDNMLGEARSTTLGLGGGCGHGTLSGSLVFCMEMVKVGCRVRPGVGAGSGCGISNCCVAVCFACPFFGARHS